MCCIFYVFLCTHGYFNPLAPAAYYSEQQDIFSLQIQQIDQFKAQLQIFLFVPMGANWLSVLKFSVNLTQMANGNTPQFHFNSTFNILFCKENYLSWIMFYTERWGAMRGALKFAGGRCVFPWQMLKM